MLEQQPVRLPRPDVLLEKELDGVGDGLGEALEADAVGPEPQLHQGHDAALEPDHDHDHDHGIEDDGDDLPDRDEEIGHEGRHLSISPRTMSSEPRMPMTSENM